MGANPAYTATVTADAPALLGAAETSLTNPTTASVIYTPGANGSKIEEIVVQAIATTVLGLVYIFRVDGGGSAHIYDTIQITAVTASTSVAPFRLRVPYSRFLVHSGWTVKASQSIAGNANLLAVHAIGGDF